MWKGLELAENDLLPPTPTNQTFERQTLGYSVTSIRLHPLSNFTEACFLVNRCLQGHLRGAEKAKTGLAECAGSIVWKWKVTGQTHSPAGRHLCFALQQHQEAWENSAGLQLGDSHAHPFSSLSQGARPILGARLREVWSSSPTLRASLAPVEAQEETHGFPKPWEKSPEESLDQ
jgi:hypothetical protein